MTDLTGKVALITGSARGIGKGVALRFSSLGARVVINYSGDAENAARVVSEIESSGGQAIAVKADVSDLTQLDDMFAAAIDTFGQLDIVVANAGKEIVDTPIIDATEADFDSLYGVNAKGAFFTLQKAAKLLADNGRLINIGSSTLSSPAPGTGLYSSSKAGAVQLVKVLAMEVGARNITVNNILPTIIDGAGVFTSGFGDAYVQFNTMRPLGGRGGTANDVADAAEYFASDLASWVSGQTLLVAGGAIQ